MIDKIVKGLYLHNLGRRLPEHAAVGDFLLNPPLQKEFQDTICTLPLRDVGDGGAFSYRFIESDVQPDLSFWFLMFFNRTLFVTQTEPNRPLNMDARRAPSPPAG
ncbi:MAG: hypothetical protein ACREV0_05785 [Burkholderiales bacterium]